VAILELTEVAAKKAKTLLASSDQPNGALRVAVRNGGCSGMRYELLFDESQREGAIDLAFFVLPVRVDPERATFLEDITIDFSDDLHDAGFKVQNPSASETCGCGESFSL